MLCVCVYIHCDLLATPLLPLKSIHWNVLVCGFLCRFDEWWGEREIRDAIHSITYEYLYPWHLSRSFGQRVFMPNQLTLIYVYTLHFHYHFHTNFCHPYGYMDHKTHFVFADFLSALHLRCRNLNLFIFGIVGLFPTFFRSSIRVKDWHW